MSWYAGVAEAFITHVKVSTCRTVISLSLQNLAGAESALLYKLGGVSIVQVPQHHHRGMLGSAEGVKLIMISLTQIQK